MYTIKELLDNNGKVIGYQIIDSQGRVLSTNPPFFIYYDDALDYLINMLDIELSRLRKEKIAREERKEIADNILIPNIKNDNGPK